jgi:2-oxo-3-hexenedioate decarboxylase
MSSSETAALARELWNAWTAGSMIATPPSSRDASFTMDDAYAVEAEVRRLRCATGSRVAGRKVGYANKAMWRALKLETLVWASMYDDTVAIGTCRYEISLEHVISPRIEPEIVFKLNQTIPRPGMDAAAALECVEWLAIGFEIIDCPFPAWQFKPVDFVAALGLHRALVVGEPTAVDAGSIPALVDQLAACKIKLFRNGALVEEGLGKNSLKSPALCLAELANAVPRQQDAAPFEPGELISTGTLTGAQSIGGDDVWQVEVEGLPLASLELSLADANSFR